MVYLSDVLKLPVLDSQGKPVGAVCDLIVNTQEAFPVVAALVVAPAASGRVPLPVHTAPLIIPWRQVVSIEEPRLRLTVAREHIHSYTLHAGEVYLARDVLDKQIVDTQGRRVVKVNDLKLAQVRGVARLLGADIGAWAFFRRLLPFRFSERLLTWNLVRPVDEERRDVHLTVPGTALADLHPADLADLLEDMHPEAGVALLKSLDVETAADAVQEMEEAYQGPLVEEMQTEHASDLLEAMPPDEAADIIGDLPEEKAAEILASMEMEPALEVKELLQYDEHTAGGLMTPEIFTLLSAMTAEQAINKLRAEGPPPETTYYLFVVTTAGELVGVVSLRALIVAKPTTPIADIMQHDVISVHVNDDQETVAAVIRKYSLLGVPVVDDRRRLLGMVLLDAVLDLMQKE
jgi:magnesium transporter